MVNNELFQSTPSSHIPLIGANTRTIIIVTRVTCKLKRDSGLAILKSDGVLPLGKIYTTQGTEVPRNLVSAILTRKLAYLASFGAS